MTIFTTHYFVNYTGDGVTVDFTYNFLVFLADDLTVQVDGVTTTDYTISGLGDADGGTITFNTAPALGSDILIKRFLALTQPIDYRPYDPFPAETHEQGLDRLMMTIQQVTIADGIYAPIDHTHAALDVTYSNTITGMTASEVQSAIDELFGLNYRTGIFYYTITDDAGLGDPISDLNATDFTIQTGTTYAPIDNVTGYIFLHKGSSYVWVGIRDVTVGVGGNHIAVSGQLSALTTSTANNVAYDNTSSGLSAINVQAALDEIDANVDAIIGRWNATVHSVNFALTDPTTPNPDMHIIDASVTVTLPATATLGDVHSLLLNAGNTLTFDLNGKTVNLPPDKLLAHRGDNTIVSLIHTGGNNWTAYGDLEST